MRCCDFDYCKDINFITFLRGMYEGQQEEI